MVKPTCPIHNRPMLCPACIGAKGGRKRSAKKTRAVRRNASKGGRPKGAPISSGPFEFEYLAILRDFEGLLSPLAMRQFMDFMHKHRLLMVRNCS